MPRQRHIVGSNAGSHKGTRRRHTLRGRDHQIVHLHIVGTTVCIHLEGQTETLSARHLDGETDMSQRAILRPQSQLNLRVEQARVRCCWDGSNAQHIVAATFDIKLQQKIPRARGKGRRGQEIAAVGSGAEPHPPTLNYRIIPTATMATCNARPFTRQGASGIVELLCPRKGVDGILRMQGKRHGPKGQHKKQKAFLHIHILYNVFFSLNTLKKTFYTPL